MPNCSVGFRCQNVFTCKVCGGHLQEKRFKSFVNSYVYRDDDIITYAVLKSNTIKNLEDGLEDCFTFLDHLRALKKHNKICDFYSRLEVSFSNNFLGFNPHINIIFFGNFDVIFALAKKSNLTIWKQKKDNKKEVVLSLVWYILKFNNIPNTPTVKLAINKKRVVLHSQRFNKKTEKTSELTKNFYENITFPIRSKKEVLYRKYIKEERRKLSKKLKKFLDNEPPFG